MTPAMSELLIFRLSTYCDIECYHYLAGKTAWIGVSAIHKVEKLSGLMLGKQALKKYFEIDYGAIALSDDLNKGEGKF